MEKKLPTTTHDQGRRLASLVIGAWSFLRARARKLHSDNNGAIAILILLTIWGFVALLAMLWNTAEYGMRRQYVQNAADSTAHAAATWMTRCTNAVAAQNMVIVQDASAETVWRAVPPTDKRIRTELERELADATAMLNNKDPAYNQRRDAILRDLVQVDTEYALTVTQLQTVQSMAGSASFTDPAAAQRFATALRQAPSALDWVQNTYVNGGAANAPGRPGPPGVNGAGLRQLVTNWATPANEQAFLQAIVDAIKQELQVLQAFESRTGPATSQDVPSQMAAHENQVFDTEQQMVDGTPDSIEQQRQQLADFTKTDLTLAVVDADPTVVGPARVLAPILPASAIDPVSDHVDLIRAQYPVETAQEFGTSDPVVIIDPINVHTDDARIWHPDQWAPVPADLQARYPGIAQKFLVNCNIPGGWGHIWAAPIERYLNERIWNDSQDLRNQYMQVIDDLRRALADQLAQMRGFSSQNQITGLPAQLRDTQPDPQGIWQPVPVLPSLETPAGASNKLKAEIAAYNQHGAAYTGAVNTLAGALRAFSGYFDRFTQAFAVATWDGNITAARDFVMREMGVAKRFMVLKTYKLRPIPDWARDGMAASAEVAIRERIIADNINGVTQNVLNAMIKLDPLGLGKAYLDPGARRAVLTAAYSPGAAQIAQGIVREVATRVAPVIAAEWIARPWPYEMETPDKPVPPTRGMTQSDRQHYFSLIAAARTSYDTNPKPLLATIYDGSPKKLIAYAQAESFNWMEFNASYGAGDRFDQVTSDIYGNFIGSPHAWRLSTIGGWNWQPHLTLSDAVEECLPVNQEFGEFMGEAGVMSTTADNQAFKPISLH